MTTQQPGYPYGGGYPQPAPGYPQPGIPMNMPAQGAAPGGWAPAPQMIMNCPPGLEYLTMVDQLLVQQKVELLEALSGFETANKYVVKNSVGQGVYFAVEDTDCCTRNCCGPSRPFDMKILDNVGHETLEVTAPPGSVIGSISQEWSICASKFRLNNAAGETVLRIDGPCCTWAICGDVQFKVMSKDGTTEVGSIRKQWSGLLKEAFTDADNFGITFPVDLDVNMKAVLLGALFLIDFMFFEKQGNKESGGVGML